MQSSNGNTIKMLHNISSCSYPLGASEAPNYLNNGLEILYYCYIIYTYLAIPYNIYVPLIAGGGLIGLALLAVTLLFQQKPGKHILFVLLILLTSGAFLAIQFLIYHFPPEDQYIRAVLFWPLSALIFGALSNEPGFIKRLSVVMLLVAFLLWPTLVLQEHSNVARMRAQGSGIDNPNDFAGFVGLPVLVFALWGLNQTRLWRRLLLWGTALAGLYLTMSTVSRGTMLALVLAVISSLRKMTLRKRLGIIFLILLVFFLVTETELFITLFESFETRGTVDTGRLRVWPEAIAIILNNPLFGVGVDNVLVYSSEIPHPISPHNCFLFFWMVSGIIPTITFTILIFATLREAFKWTKGRHDSMIDPLPLMIFALVQINLSPTVFVSIYCLAPMFYSATRERSRSPGKVNLFPAQLSGRRVGMLNRAGLKGHGRHP